MCEGCACGQKRDRETRDSWRLFFPSDNGCENRSHLFCHRPLFARFFQRTLPSLAPPPAALCRPLGVAPMDYPRPRRVGGSVEAEVDDLCETLTVPQLREVS